MPPLDEGTIFYMPSTMPGISIANAEKLLRSSDRIIKQVPEVDRVLGKTGRADTPTDPAPLSMLETIVTLKPTSEWRTAPTWYSSWAPGWARTILRRITPDHISQEQLVRELDEAVDIPGLSNAWTMPVRARTGMLTTGIRTPIGLKISGGDGAQRKRTADRLRLRRSRGPRREQLREGGRATAFEQPDASARVHDFMERSVRGHAACRGAADRRRAGDGRAHAPLAVSEHSIHREDTHRCARGSLFGDWRRLVPLSARLQHERRRVGRVDRARRRRRRDGRLHVAVCGSRLRAGQAGRTAAFARCLAGGDRPGRREALAAETDDGRNDVLRPAADHVGVGHRIGRHEADCRSARRRHPHVVSPRARRVSASLSDLEVARSEAHAAVIAALRPI